METVVEMFRKLGLRQTLVTHNGSVSMQATIRAAYIPLSNSLKEMLSKSTCPADSFTG